ncbi:nucleotidyl transferase AbiEii/AbiGii toxin family protein [Bacteroides sp.]|uniref:nucleotidyl transferase AbiEii/AbiGii toxin family protein n=1 Tax=Bacteroides sp. TaxID=29523 RepID=UPI0025B882B5|nr:nucleotidyl transferase AbiEii/AbiGii toxin family protein [Bacteroides sp.]
MNQNKHKFFMMQILKDIFSDVLLASSLGFKGGTALMFFYNLPRFSVDLDFNLLDKSKEDIVYAKIRRILLRYGKIFDEAKKFYGPIIVLDYGIGERKLKVEISNREYDNHYEIKNLLGINMRVLVKPDMFAHKLCALLDRTEVTGRDIFDCWFFLQSHTPVNAHIIEQRMNQNLSDYIDRCIEQLEHTSDKIIMSGLGELADTKTKGFVKNKLRLETIQLLQMFKAFPDVAE